MRFGVGHGGKRHALLVVRAVGREGFLDRMQRFSETGHVAMPEDRPDAAKQRLRAVFREHFLRRQIAHQRLRHRQPNRSHSHTSIICIQPAGCFHHARIGTRKTRRFVGNHDSAVPT
jgi:Xaa-Pro aminopeptidase